MADESKNSWDDDIMAKRQKGYKNALKHANKEAVKLIKKAADEGKSEITMELVHHLRRQFVNQWNAKHQKVTAHALYRVITFEWD